MGKEKGGGYEGPTGYPDTDRLLQSLYTLSGIAAEIEERIRRDETSRRHGWRAHYLSKLTPEERHKFDEGFDFPPTPRWPSIELKAEELKALEDGVSDAKKMLTELGKPARSLLANVLMARMRSVTLDINLWPQTVREKLRACEAILPRLCIDSGAINSLAFDFSSACTDLENLSVTIINAPSELRTGKHGGTRPGAGSRAKGKTQPSSTQIDRMKELASFNGGKLNYVEAAAELHKDAPTVKRWWNTLKKQEARKAETDSKIRKARRTQS